MNREISIDYDHYGEASEQSIRLTLLHEMCHATSRGTHGQSWQREMQRIIAAEATRMLQANLRRCARMHVRAFSG